jgi:endonuclease/exonuclease/phosphatase family metal-dependent hydrolase
MNQFFASVAAIALTLTTVLVAQQPALEFLRKPSADAIRVLTWNVYRNSILPKEGRTVDVAGAGRPSQFARVLRAVQPDVVCLQEITASARRSAALLDEILPLGDGRTWQAHAAVDTVIATRFDLGARGGGRVEDGTRRRGHAIAVIKAPGTDLYMICAHFQSSDAPGDVALRQRHAVLLVNTVREAKIGVGVGVVPLRARVPLLILGDFNAIPGGAAFVDAIASGTVTPTAAGTGDGLDWDDSSLTDAQPHHNVSGSDVYTWRNDLEPFPPGALDRILYSDSILSSVNQFVLDTTTMSYADLVGTGLRTIDVMRDPRAGIHDHFPLVIDLVIRKDGLAHDHGGRHP